MGQLARFALVAFLFIGAAKVALAESPSSLTWEDLQGLTDTDLITVVAPGDSTPDEVVRTIIHDESLPEAVRQPFVTLAQAKARYLLAPAGAVASVTEP